MIRVHVSTPIRSGEDLWLDGERAHYLSRVMRVRRGDELVVFDGCGGEFRCSVSDITKQRVRLVPGQYSTPETESGLEIRLVQGISRGDRMDAVVQKATELGVHRISPVSTEFSVVRLDARRSEKKTEHWQRIAQSACEQCGRNTVPQIDEPAELLSVLGNDCGGTRLVLLPGSRQALADLAAPEGTLTLLIGPEGGFSDQEEQLALARGFLPRSLGPRILRTETAAIAALAILQSHFGDIGRAASPTPAD
jgi:16S rRNA (uracil1498-N3)-methyltransferase